MRQNKLASNAAGSAERSLDHQPQTAAAGRSRTDVAAGNGIIWPIDGAPYQVLVIP